MSRTTREKAEEALTELLNYPNGEIRQVKGLKIDSKEVEGGRCMRGIEEKLCFSEKERGKVCKDYVKGIMNEENDWGHNVEGYAVEDPVVCVGAEEMLLALSEMKSWKNLDLQNNHQR